jgi:arginine decarboxylase
MQYFHSKKYFLFTGINIGMQEKLSSFDAALVDAKVDCYNFVKVSSICPPFFKQSKTLDVPKGSILYAAYASLTEKGSRVISSAIAVGIPREESQIGVIMEYSSHESKYITEERAREMVRVSMALRNIDMSDIISVSAEIQPSTDRYSTTIAGVALW